MNNNENENKNGNKRRKRLEARILSSRGRSLFDYEILELILYSTYRKVKSRAVAEKLIGLFNNVGRVVNADFHELKSISGMNSSAIATIFCINIVDNEEARYLECLIECNGFNLRGICTKWPN